ncbi:MAG: phosphoglycerate mutase [Cyclobacteriaceae bacterium]|nr:MAG: phosphoglycerate mutase [Cyclobacteriaceae bacterium]
MSNGKGSMAITKLQPIIMAFLAIIIIVSWIWCWWWPVPVTTVYISRHAEKLNYTSDTPLSPVGEVRALELAHVLKDEGIDAVFVTQFLRTQQTGQPTATESGVNVIQYDAGISQEVVDAILANHIGQQVLVIGHSNTVDDIAIGLGAPGVPELDELQFDRLFVVHRFGSTVHLDRLRYGVETP